MLNAVWAVLVLSAVAFGLYRGSLDAVALASVDSAKTAVQLVISLLGPMIFWLGLMHAFQKAGFMAPVARALKKPLSILFPDVPTDHPAMRYMIMNVTANMLGLGNAATPFGIKAIVELNKLNRHQGVASNAMALFLAINTSSVTLFNTGMVVQRAALGSDSPGIILLPTLFATICSTAVAILAAKLLQNIYRVPNITVDHFEQTPDQGSAWSQEVSNSDEIEMEKSVAWARGWPFIFRLTLSGSLAVGFAVWGWARVHTLSHFDPHFSLFGAIVSVVSEDGIYMMLLSTLVALSWLKDVALYDAAVQGGTEAIEICKKILPYLVVLLTALGMFRASGGLDVIVGWLYPVLSMIDMPAEGVMMGIVRTLSGSGATAWALDVMGPNGAGPDSYVGVLVSTMSGSTETTFYVLALYFGAANIRHGRHTLLACLCADITGMLMSLFAVQWLLGMGSGG